MQFRLIFDLATIRSEKQTWEKFGLVSRFVPTPYHPHLAPSLIVRFFFFFLCRSISVCRFARSPCSSPLISHFRSICSLCTFQISRFANFYCRNRNKVLRHRAVLLVSRFLPHTHFPFRFHPGARSLRCPNAHVSR